MIREFVLGVALYASLTAAAQADTRAEIFETQRYLNKLGYEAGSVDGLWGNATKRALDAFLSDLGMSFDGTLDGGELKLLEAEMTSRGMSLNPVVDWEYRATSIGFGGYNSSGQPAYDMIKTISEVPDFGFNVLTLDIRCTGRRDPGLPKHYPIGRQLGCDIPNKPVFEDEGFASTRRDATSLAIDEARDAGLKVNLKPMFLELGRRFGKPNAAGFGTMPVDTFFDGDGKTWSGYRSIILSVAEYAAVNNVEYLTLGTELTNLNSKIETSKRWSELISEVRKIYKGRLIYATNYNNKRNFRNLSDSHILRYVDVVGLNFFPTQMMGGRKDYTENEVAKALRSAKFKNGHNMFKEARRLQGELGVPIILSETHFPTWVGSANYFFRGGCDYKNEGRSGWQFTKGPLAPKIPSDEHGRILAEGFMLAFEDQEWVAGADYVFWTVAHAFDPRTDTREYGPCSSWLWNSDDGIKEMIRAFHGTR